jgi:UDP-3-O-[3-hydroxymyristoyl] glucosamine N-acyltransferase
MGRHCIMVSQSGLSGSCDIGDFTVIGGQVGVADHVKIGKGAFLASRSGVSRSLEGGKVYGGFPARPIEHWRREIALLSRLVKGRQTKNDGGGSHD